ncbi:hypothetical protein AHAS_Ahas19G0098900 [Arachis hypogaea]
MQFQGINARLLFRVDGGARVECNLVVVALWLRIGQNVAEIIAMDFERMFSVEVEDLDGSSSNDCRKHYCVSDNENDDNKDFECRRGHDGGEKGDKEAEDGKGSSGARLQHSVWKVRTIIDEHNHELALAMFTHLLPSHRKMSDVTRHKLISNKYKKPLVVFSESNNHKQTPIFGFTLLEDEDVRTYRWVLLNLLDVMGQKKPCVMVTDGDKAMRVAIMEDFEEYWKTSVESLGLHDNS